MKVITPKNVLLEVVRNNFSVIRDVAKRAKTFYTATIDEYSVARWILQWNDERSIRLALDILKHIRFVDTDGLTALLHRALEKLPPDVQNNATLSTLGKAFDSCGLVTYHITKSLHLREKDLARRWSDLSDLAKSPSNGPIIMFDDNITSGTQMMRIFDEMFPNFSGEREHIKEPLDVHQLAALQQRRIYVIVAIQLGDPSAAVQHVQRRGFEIEVVFGDQDASAPLSYPSALCDTPEHAEFARDCIANISRRLFAKKKAWTKEMMERRLLGYGNNAKFTIFQHNIPKSLPAPFWKIEEAVQQPWIPLFPEREEWTRHSRQIQRCNAKGDPLWEAAKRIVESVRTTPKSIKRKTLLTHKRVLWPLLHGTVPDAPPHYIERKELLNRIVRATIEANPSPVGLAGHRRSLGVQGMGGVGKTVLAAALTRETAVRKAFSDGLFWLTLGQQPNTLALLNQLAAALQNPAGPFASVAEAKAHLREGLLRKRVLLILDDVWHVDHVSAFNFLPTESRLLVTTRKRELLIGLGALEFSIDVLSETEAIRMLASWAGISDLSAMPPDSFQIAKSCGYLPLALSMIGGMVKLRPDAWADVLELLNRRELCEFQRSFPDYPYPDLLRAIAVSVDDLSDDDRERYLDLSVFPEDTPIPEGPLEILWGLTPEKTRSCIDRIASRSLGTIRSEKKKLSLLLHDLQGDYIRKQREQSLSTVHKRLVHGYGKRCKISKRARDSVKKHSLNSYQWHLGPNDGYFFQYIVFHLIHAGYAKNAVRLLLCLDWYETKAARSMAFELDQDLCWGEKVSTPRLARHKLLPLLREALRRSVNFIVRHPSSVYTNCFFSLPI